MHISCRSHAQLLPRKLLLTSPMDMVAHLNIYHQDKPTLFAYLTTISLITVSVEYMDFSPRYWRPYLFSGFLYSSTFGHFASHLLIQIWVLSAMVIGVMHPIIISLATFANLFWRSQPRELSHKASHPSWMPVIKLRHSAQLRNFLCTIRSTLYQIIAACRFNYRVLTGTSRLLPREK